MINIQINEDSKTEKIKFEVSVRQADLISLKLFTPILKDVFTELQGNKIVISIDGNYSNHLSFAGDVILICNNRSNLQRMLKDLNDASR